MFDELNFACNFQCAHYAKKWELEEERKKLKVSNRTRRSIYKPQTEGERLLLNDLVNA